jgi:hypothetical protein
VLTACAIGSDSAPDLGVDDTESPENILTAALLDADEIGDEWEFIPPLKQEDKALHLTCGSGANISQTEVPTKLARGAHFAGRLTPLIRPQLTEKIVIFEPGGAEQYTSDLIECKDRHERIELGSYGDETLTLYFRRDDRAFVEDYIVVVRRGDAVMQLDYSIYQVDLSDHDVVESLARKADAKFEVAVTLLE